MRVAKIGRNQHFGDSRRAHAGIGELVADQLLQLLAKAFGDAFIALRIGRRVTVWSAWNFLTKATRRKFYGWTCGPIGTRRCAALKLSHNSLSTTTGWCIRWKRAWWRRPYRTMLQFHRAF